MKSAIIFALAFAFNAIAIHQGRADEIAFRMAVQLRLVQDGFYKSRPDARIGPLTKKAMAAFAEEHGITPDFKSVSGQMARLAASERVEMPDEVREMAIAAVKKSLNDPYSADVKPSHAYFTPFGMIAVCGEVNAKNAYGAYTGFQWFQVLLQPLLSDEAIGRPTFQDEGALEFCLLGTSLMALRRLD